MSIARLLEEAGLVSLETQLTPQLKVGADAQDDLRRGTLIRSIIDNPDNMPKDRKPITKESIEGKNAGPTGCVLMVDANRECCCKS
jgi:hypothetical protein